VVKRLGPANLPHLGRFTDWRLLLFAVVISVSGRPVRHGAGSAISSGNLNGRWWKPDARNGGRSGRMLRSGLVVLEMRWRWWC